MGTLAIGFGHIAWHTALLFMSIGRVSIGRGDCDVRGNAVACFCGEVLGLLQTPVLASLGGTDLALPPEARAGL